MAATALILLAIVMGGTGLDCDQNAQADFRETVAPVVADGVKTILDGLIDGFAAAVVNAGDGPTE
jgi:hypothetical protein